MKKAINAAAAAIVALGPISLFVFTTLFVAPPANACEGGPAAVQLCLLACSKGGQSAECPASGAQPAGPPQQAPRRPRPSRPHQRSHHRHSQQPHHRHRQPHHQRLHHPQELPVRELTEMRPSA